MSPSANIPTIRTVRGEWEIKTTRVTMSIFAAKYWATETAQSPERNGHTLTQPKLSHAALNLVPRAIRGRSSWERGCFGVTQQIQVRTQSLDDVILTNQSKIVSHTRRRIWTQSPPLQKSMFVNVCPHTTYNVSDECLRFVSQLLPARKLLQVAGNFSQTWLSQRKIWNDLK